MIRKGMKRTAAWTTALMMAFSAQAGFAQEAETQQGAQPTPVTEEAGYSEIESLLEMNELGDLSGMNLEEITDAFANGAMKEYLNEKAGFSMLYPSVLEWDESGLFAVSPDGKATLQIESIPNGGEKNLAIISEMTKKSEPDCLTEYNQKSSQLKLKRTDRETKLTSVDLYLETDTWIHHAYLVFPEDQEETYGPYVDFMLNSMTSSESEQG